jgi:hypothetical protein
VEKGIWLTKPVVRFSTAWLKAQLSLLGIRLS